MTQPGTRNPSGTPLDSVDTDKFGPTLTNSMTEVRLLHIAKLVLRCRRAFTQMLPPELINDPVQEILLNLYIAETEGRHIGPSDACLSRAVPPAATRRWLHALADHGLLIRLIDNEVGESGYVALSIDAREALEDWLNTLEQIFRDAMGYFPSAPINAPARNPSRE